MKWLSRLRWHKDPQLLLVFTVPEPESFLAFFNHLTSMARNTTLKYGGHYPLVVVGTSQGAEGFAISEFIDRGDDGRMALIEALWTRYGGKADWFARVSEAWEAKIPDGTQPYEIRPSEQPDRQEVLRMSAVNREGLRVCRRFVMGRDEAGRIVDLIGEGEGDSGFQDLLEAPLLGTRLEWLAPVFDPTTR